MKKIDWRNLLERDIYRERMFLKGLILLLAAWHLGAFLWVGLQRFSYPFELEWTEGAEVQTVLRLMENQPIYTESTLEWSSPLSTPLYYYIGWALMSVFGAGFVQLRLISIIAAVGAGILLYRFLRKQDIEDSYSLAGFGLYFAAFSATGSWYDLAHGDSAALFLAVWSFYIAGEGKSWLRPVLSAVLAALSFFTSQYFIAAPILLGIYWYLIDRRKFYYFLTACLSIFVLGAITIYLLNGSGLWATVSSWPHLSFSRVFTFWAYGCPLKFPLLCVLSAFTIFFISRKIISGKYESHIPAFALMAGGLIIVSWLGYITTGSYDNVFIPAAAAMAALSAWALQHFKSSEYNLGWLPPVAVKVLVIIQLILFITNPGKLMPSDEDVKAGGRFIEKISSLDGEVYIPKHGYYQYLAGKGSYLPYAHLRGRISPRGEGFYIGLPEDLTRAIAEKHFDFIIIDEPADFWLEAISPYYRLEEEIFANPLTFQSKSGEITRPQFIFRP